VKDFEENIAALGALKGRGPGKDPRGLRRLCIMRRDFTMVRARDRGRGRVAGAGRGGGPGTGSSGAACGSV
jgi:hypothetical protein